MAARRRVLHLSSATVFGGNEEHVRALVTHIDPARFDVTVALPPEAPLKEALATTHVKTVPMRFGGWRDPLAATRLTRALKRGGYDVVHSHNRREDLALALARTHGAVPITTMHDRPNMTDTGTRKRGVRPAVYGRLLVRRFARIIAVSEATRRDLVEHVGVPETQVVHVTNGTDLARLDSAVATDEARERLAIAPGTFVLGFTARLTGTGLGKKGVKYALEALAQLRGSHPNLLLLAVGADEEARTEIARRAEALGVGELVRAEGFRDDIVEVMCAFDAAVLPSLFEGLPRALMEAMALGKPVVGTNVDGIAELVEDGVSGLLVAPRDANTLAGAIRRLVDDDALRDRMGEAAGRRVRERFSAERMARETEEVYDDVLAG